MAGRLTFLGRAQVETLHRNALRVLAETGVRVEHEDLVRRLEALGGTVSGGGRVRFAPAHIERHVFGGTMPAATQHRVRVFAGVYQSWYLEPETGRLEPFTEDRLARYIGLAAKLPLVSHTHPGWTHEERIAAGIPEALIRYSVGIEETGDLVADLQQALSNG